MELLKFNKNGERKINRDDIGRILFKIPVIDTRVEQDKKELRVYLTLSNHYVLLVKYDVKNRSKSYYIYDHHRMNH